MAELGARPVQHSDTAGAARSIAERGDKTIAAIGPKLAAEIYGLEILRAAWKTRSTIPPASLSWLVRAWCRQPEAVRA